MGGLVPFFAVLVASNLLAPTASRAAETLRIISDEISESAYLGALVESYRSRSGTTIELVSGDASRALRHVTRGKADIAAVDRYKRERFEDEAAADMTPIAWDALIVVTHPNNPVTGISLSELRAVLLGDITDWKALGGRAGKINIMATAQKYSGTGYSLRELVLGDISIDLPHARSFKTVDAMESATARDPRAIAITSFYTAQTHSLKVLPLDGVTPDRDNISQGKYPLCRPLYLATNADSGARAAITAFMEFANSNNGRRLVSANAIDYLGAATLTIRQTRQKRASWEWYRTEVGSRQKTRDAALAKKQAARAATRKKQQQSARKSAAETVRQAKNTVLTHKWFLDEFPVEALPSNVNRCKDKEKTIICLSKKLSRELGADMLTYRIQSRMDNFKPDGSFMLRIRKEIISLSSHAESDSDYGSTDTKGIQPGWQDKEKTMACSLSSAKHITCRKNNFDYHYTAVPQKSTTPGLPPASK